MTGRLEGQSSLALVCSLEERCASLPNFSGQYTDADPGPECSSSLAIQANRGHPKSGHNSNFISMGRCGIFGSRVCVQNESREPGY